MAINTLSLPVDIPWKRLCISDGDMIDEKICDREFPYRWRSSVAVFAYEPPQEHQTYDDMTVSYLKVVCTITGLQAGEEVRRELGMLPDPKKYLFNDKDVTALGINAINKYYACYGAILEVSLKPSGTAEDDKSKYPYFIDFEPKKRELYELVTETGEMLSRSLDEINVQKGTTTTAGTEVVDKGKTGVKGGVDVGVVELGVSGESEKAVKNINITDRSDVRTSDRSREAREMYSHTTQLTQMYHQFTSYHLGTSRAVFFMLPRPHILETERTFVQGPRAIEGIQEVFLVVMRPKDVPKFCVEAYLETAHIDFEHVDPKKKHDTWTWTIDYPPPGPLKAEYFSEPQEKEFEHVYQIRSGWEIDYETENGVKVEPIPYQEGEIQERVGGALPGDFFVTDVPFLGFSIDASEVAVTITVRLGIAASLVGPFEEAPRLPYYYANLAVTVYLRKAGDEGKEIPKTLFLTGREACCCPPERIFPESLVTMTAVTAEIRKPEWSSFNLLSRRSMAIREANRFRADIGETMLQSVNDPHRYPRGTVSILETQFLAQRIAPRIGRTSHPDNQLVQEFVGLKPEIRDQIIKLMPRLRRADVLRMQLQETRDRLSLSHEEAVHLRRAALGLTAPVPEPKDRWDPPSSRIEHNVPRLTGLSLNEGTILLNAEDLRVGEVTYQDSEQPNGIVLSQEPKAGEMVRAGTEVNLILATGLTVRIPDVVGRPLSEALCMLLDAGLRSEPELDFVFSPERRRHTVVDVTPAARTYVTPNATVVLRLDRADSDTPRIEPSPRFSTRGVGRRRGRFEWTKPPGGL